jgi:two-component system sensor histidine kinase AlgZ
MMGQIIRETAGNVSRSELPQSEFFLPDFCALRSVFAVVVLAELFAFILTLAAYPYSSDPWGDLALTSLFMQWAGLISAALLCVARRPLSRLDSTPAGLLAYLLLLLTITLLSEGAFYLLQHTATPLFTTDHTEFLLRNLAIGAIVTALALRYFYVQHQWKQRTRAEAEARLQALQARIRPHFLFNSINTVTNLIHSQPDAAEEALLDLSDLFRASLGKERRRISFREEAALTRRYLHMESLRLGERLRVEWDSGAVPDDAQLPPLILQPLVENAVYHGIEPSPAGGTVALHGTVANGQLVLTLDNPLPPGDTPRKQGNRMALENIRERLAAHYGETASLELSEQEGQFRVILTLPLQCETEETT